MSDRCTCSRRGGPYCPRCRYYAEYAGLSLPTRLQALRSAPQTAGQTSPPSRRSTGVSERSASLLPPGAALGTMLPLRLTNAKSAHEYWQTTRKRVQFQRQYVYEKLMALWEDGASLGLPLTITITRIAPRALDDDNLAFATSACRDGIADWLAGCYGKGQDRQQGLHWLYAQRRVAPAFYAVEIRVERPRRKAGCATESAPCGSDRT